MKAIQSTCRLAREAGAEQFLSYNTPSQWVMSRFMNLAPLFDWGSKMLKIIDIGLLGTEEREKVAFLPQYRAFILQTSHLLNILKSVQQVLKTEHLCPGLLKNAS